jgi:predicted dinucleotide-binding enzyme
VRIAVIGKGRVGTALAPALVQAGHEVVYGVRDPADPKYAGGDDIPLRATGEAAQWAETIVAAINWNAIGEFLAEAGDLSGKILIDCINPYDFAAGLKPLIDGNQSAAQIIAARTEAIVVKALNQVGSPVMAQARDYSIRPLQFVAADDDKAKRTVIALLEDIGFDARDAGGLEYAADLEGMARLWIAQAFAHGMPLDTGWALVRPAGEGA